MQGNRYGNGQRSRGSEEELDIWQFLNRIVMALSILGLFALSLTYFFPELERQKKLNAELAELQATKASLEETRRKKKAELNWLRSDPEYLEMIARDRLDLYRPGETILRVE